MLLSPHGWEDNMKTFPCSIKTMHDFSLYVYERNKARITFGWFNDNEIKWLKQNDIHTMALRVGSALSGLGICFGDRVGVYSENRIEVVVLLEACNLFGFISVLTFDASISTYPKYTLNDAGVKCLYISSNKMGNYNKIFDSPISGLDFLILNQESRFCKMKYYLFSELTICPIIELPQIDPETICTICYSSGTVGAPKGVVLSHKAILYGVKLTLATVEVVSRDIQISYLPIAHILERITLCVYQFRGARVVFSRNGVQSLIEDMKQAKVTGGASIPYVLNNIHDVIIGKCQTPIKKFLLRSALMLDSVCRYFGFCSRLAGVVFCPFRQAFGGELRWFGCAGDVFDPEIHFRLMQILNIEIITVYGMSEFSGPITVVPKQNIIPGTVGVPVPGVEVKLSTENEVLVKSPGSFTTYWKRDEIKMSSFCNGWFRTGDKGYIHSSGFLVVTGRAFDTFRYLPGVELAIPFLRFTYKKCGMIDDIFITPLEEYNILIGIVSMTIETAKKIVKKELSASEYDELIRNPNFRWEVLNSLNDHGRKQNLRDGSYLESIRITKTEFSTQTGFLTLTGKQRYHEFIEIFQPEILDMKQEISNKFQKGINTK